MPKDITELVEVAPGLRVGQVMYDVSDVKKMSPLAIIGRFFGGCRICGTNRSGSHHIIGVEVKQLRCNLSTTVNPWVCSKCQEKCLSDL